MSQVIKKIGLVTNKQNKKPLANKNKQEEVKILISLGTFSL